MALPSAPKRYEPHRAIHPLPPRVEALLGWVFVVGGLAVGLVVALPVKPAPGCPSGQAGGIACQLQYSWSPAAMKVAGVMLAAHLLDRLLMEWIPTAAHRLATGLARRVRDTVGIEVSVRRTARRRPVRRPAAADPELRGAVVPLGVRAWSDSTWQHWGPTPVGRDRSSGHVARSKL